MFAKAQTPEPRPTTEEAQRKADKHLPFTGPSGRATGPDAWTNLFHTCFVILGYSRSQISAAEAQDPLRSPPNRSFRHSHGTSLGRWGSSPLPPFFLFLTKVCHGTYPFAVEVTKRGLMRGCAAHHRERVGDGRRTPNKNKRAREEHLNSSYVKNLLAPTRFFHC